MEAAAAIGFGAGILIFIVIFNKKTQSEADTVNSRKNCFILRNKIHPAVYNHDVYLNYNHIFSHLTPISLELGVIPDYMKHTSVQPRFKRPNQEPPVFSNFRLISNSLFLSKIQEKIVLLELESFVVESKIFDTFELGFRKPHSTDAALLKFLNEVVATNCGDSVGLGLFYLSAAFDSVDHNVLLYHLEQVLGIRGSALSWFQLYLTNRRYSWTPFDAQSIPDLNPNLLTPYFKPYVKNLGVNALNLDIQVNQILKSSSYQSHPFQMVQNVPARVLTGALKHEHITHVWRTLHRLPFRHNFGFKVFSLVTFLAPLTAKVCQSETVYPKLWNSPKFKSGISILCPLINKS